MISYSFPRFSSQILVYRVESLLHCTPKTPRNFEIGSNWLNIPSLFKIFLPARLVKKYVKQPPHNHHHLIHGKKHLLVLY